LIPKLHYISEGKTPKEVLENIQKACTSGIEIVQLKLDKLSDKKFLKLATEVREITSHFQTRLIINQHYKIAKEVKADGVHLEKNHACPIDARKHVFTWQIIGGTANTLQDCEKLIEKQVDYIMLSPFRNSTEINKDTTVLGLNGFTLITEALKTETPLIGYGEITTDDITDILNTGVSGVAVMEEITKDFDVIKTFNQLLKASSTDEMRHTF
jgi:thiamine-phosphate pyrophosphorylase